MADTLRWTALALCGLMLSGAAHGRGPWRADEANTTGWQLMNPEERIEHQARIRGFDNYADCRAYQREHHALMAARAAERGLRLPSARRDACAHLRTNDAPPRE